MSEKVPMTKEGYESLMQEVKRLKEVERPKIVKEIGIAREHGDLSENAEYHAAKEKQGLIEGRIKDLESKLAGAQLLDTSKATPGTVVFGATVRLEDEDTGETVTYRIVGADEADIKQKTISIHSPIARALIGHKIGDSVEVIVPSGTKEFTILDVIFE
ncbi:MAG: transcription elongation factor GreA [Thermodesulfobacteriota bacterium]|nr:transcription elongation factor GreA [Thermodesulfobacteriota bacterium]